MLNGVPLCNVYANGSTGIPLMLNDQQTSSGPHLPYCILLECGASKMSYIFFEHLHEARYSGQLSVVPSVSII